MLRNKLSPLLACLLIFALALSACSSKETSQPTSSGAAEETAAAATKAADSTSPEAVIADPFGKYEQPVDVTIAFKPNSKTDDLPPGDTLESNAWTKGYEQDLGIKVTYPWIVSPEQYENKLNVTIASGDIPDIMEVTAQTFKQLSDAGKLEDLTEVFDKYASPIVKQEMGSNGGLPLKAATMKGKLVALPELGGTIQGEARMLWIRTDWLKKVNLPEPKTMDDVLAISKAFTKNDPDGNNKNDTYGLAMFKGLSSGFIDINGFANSYHAYTGNWDVVDPIWIKDASGKLVSSIIQPEWKTALGKLQEMYKDGQIDPEFGTKDADKVTQDISAGKLGMFYGDYWSMFALGDLFKKDPKAEFKPFPLLSADEKPASPGVGFTVGSYFVVKKGYPHPEVLVKLMNYFYLKSLGKDGQGNSDAADVSKFNTSSDGKYNPYKEASIQLAPIAAPDTVKVRAAVKSGDPSALNPSQKTSYDNYVKGKNGDRELYPLYTLYDEVLSPFKIQDYYTEQNLTIVDYFYGGSTKRLSEKGAALRKLNQETFTKIIMGAVPVSEFDKFVESWRKLGGDQITQEVNDWYNSSK